MENSGAAEKYMEIKEQKIELAGETILHMNEIRKWAQFLSILGFVTIGLLLLIGIIMIVASLFVASSIGSALQYDQFGLIGPLMGVFYFIFAVIYFFPVFYLYRFSQHAKHSLVHIGMAESSTEQMSKAIAYLKKHYRYIGIMTIILLATYPVVIIGVIVAIAMR
ncbi:MAG: hypothetical protein NTW10_11740 [Bacteroidetes bacterium]|nr:hypothetical protein [Bacteroidota bacterium]